MNNEYAIELQSNIYRAHKDIIRNYITWLRSESKDNREAIVFPEAVGLSSQNS